MAFKRPRLNHYGLHKPQRIVQNGVSQLSPLDRKQLPLDQQKQVSLAISSEDRDGIDTFPPSSPTDCVINFVESVKNVYAYRVLSFSFVNNFYSIQNGINEQLTVTWTVAPTLSSGDNYLEVNAGVISLLEGYYTFSVNPIDWLNPLLVTQLDLNDILYTNIGVLMASYSNDIRVAFLNRSLGTITRIQTNRETKQITIIWAATRAPIIDSENSNIIDVLGLSRVSSGSSWVGVAPVSCNGPSSIALVSDVLNNSELIDPQGPNEFFQHLTVSVKQGDIQEFLPPNPPLVTLNSQAAIVRVPFKIVDHVSQRVLKGTGIRWLLVLGVYSIDTTPAV